MCGNVRPTYRESSDSRKLRHFAYSKRSKIFEISRTSVISEKVSQPNRSADAALRNGAWAAAATCIAHDAGRTQPKLEVFCLAELLQDIIDGYQVKAQASRVTVALSASSKTAASVLADIALMERVFQNLIDNALRHTPQGGAVSIAIAPGPTELRVSVTDTGSGIAQKHLAHVFERYYRAQDTGSAHGGPSAGLGLAIVKRILELHGSAIRVSSELARGTRFDFSLQRVG